MTTNSDIGNFEIGVSPIGANGLDWTNTILSQYANSPILLALIESFFDAIDASNNIDSFYQKVWNIQTAEGYGLDVWGRIVGVTRIISLPNAGRNFGFEEGTTATYDPFNQSAFYAGQLPQSNYALSDSAFRVLILVKALFNISNCSISSYNTMLMKLFPNRGNAFATDVGNMEMRLTFNFLLQPFEISILKQSGAFSNPTGVLMNIAQIPAMTFGFAETADVLCTGFNNGTFFGGFL